MANENGNGRNGNGERDFCASLSYRDIDVAKTELKGLVRLARDCGALSVPTSASLGVLVFRYDSWYNARDFYNQALENFHFNSGEISPKPRAFD